MARKPAETITLENQALRLEFCAGTGALTGCSVPATEWTVLERAHLGLSFKLLVPA